VQEQARALLPAELLPARASQLPAPSEALLPEQPLVQVPLVSQPPRAAAQPAQREQARLAFAALLSRQLLSPYARIPQRIRRPPRPSDDPSPSRRHRQGWNWSGFSFQLRQNLAKGQ